MLKTANSIIVGGPIAVGKSTLVGSLSFVAVSEFNSNDELQDLLLNQMYKGNEMAAKIFQLDLLLTRFDKYKKLANNKKTHVFDRSIFEDVFFAENWFKNDINDWNYYKAIWSDRVEEIMTEIGKPKLYILLTCSWDTFVERLFNRNIDYEINNFQKNKLYFKNMIKVYENYMVKIFKKYNLDYVIIDTNNLNNLEIIEKFNFEINKKGIL